MLGMFLSIRRRQIIRIDFFVEKLPEGLRVVTGFVITPDCGLDLRLPRGGVLRVPPVLRQRPDDLPRRSARDGSCRRW
jgi:hypothetical protein